MMIFRAQITDHIRRKYQAIHMLQYLQLRSFQLKYICVTERLLRALHHRSKLSKLFRHCSIHKAALLPRK